MTNAIHPQNQNIPAYSGITINITNPTLTPPPIYQNCAMTPPTQNNNFNNTQYNVVPQNNPYNQNLGYVERQQYNTDGSQYHSAVSNSTRDLNTNYNDIQQNRSNNEQYNSASSNNIKGTSLDNREKQNYDTASSEVQNIQKENNLIESKTASQEKVQTIDSREQLPQAYPAPYYLNNYNYIQNGEKGNSQTFDNLPQGHNNNFNIVEPKEDLSKSTNIITDINNRIAEQKELEKHGKQTKIVALTNEYIMSLENYLNNPNTEIRLMAAKEVLTRLDEDKDRYDDAALNALLNKMLQDPAKLVRVAALSAFSSQLASGNEYTIKLLTNIQNNPHGDKEDALQAANSLLRMSSRTEIKYVPAKKDNAKKSDNKELEESQKQVQQLKEQLNKYKEKEIENYIKTTQGKK